MTDIMSLPLTLKRKVSSRQAPVEYSFDAWPYAEMDVLDLEWMIPAGIAVGHRCAEQFYAGMYVYLPDLGLPSRRVARVESVMVCFGSDELELSLRLIVNDEKSAFTKLRSLTDERR